MNTTITADPSSPPFDPTSKDEMGLRSATIDKAVARLTEVSERMIAIDKALGSMLPDFIAHHPLGEAVDKLSALKTVIEATEEAQKALNARLSFAREISMPARMDAEEIQTFNTEANRITRTSRIFASIIASEMDRAKAWLISKNLGSLIKETINSSSLSAAAKAQIEEGYELPDDIFTCHIKDSVSITRKKK